MNAGVVGVGSIGRNHARVYAELDCTRLAAVYDTDARAAQDVARRYGAEAAGSLEEFAERVELASVATPRSSNNLATA